MSEIIELLEHELETAVEVKDRRALHRYVTILVDRVVSRSEHQAAETRLEQKLGTELGALRSDVQTIAARMEQGFARMDERFAAVDKRFEQVDKRFDDVNKRFGMLVALTTSFFVVLAGMMTALRIFG